MMAKTCRTSRRPSRPVLPAVPPAAGATFHHVSVAGTGLPWRILFHGADGVGKTSLAAQFPAPVFLYSQGDSGLETLLDSGRLQRVAHFPAIEDWEQLLDDLAQLADATHAYQTVVLDGLSGFERLCHERICARDFAGDWGELGFHGYQRGYEVAVVEWRRLIAALERLRVERQLQLVLLSASRVVPYRNPCGADYDRFCPDLHAKAWSVTQRWADVVGFLNFVPPAAAPRRSARCPAAQPQLVRHLSVERSVGHDAKNRPGLPAEIALSGDTAASAYAAWQHALARLQPRQAAPLHAPRQRKNVHCPLNATATRTPNS